MSGKWLYPNGSHFDGGFDNNKPKGRGKWNFENGNVVEGDYTQIKRADVESENEIKLSWKTTSDCTVAPKWKFCASLSDKFWKIENLKNK